MHYSDYFITGTKMAAYKLEKELLLERDGIIRKANVHCNVK
jgi:hypothetical protein